MSDPLANPIADPLVELPDVSPTSDLVEIEATQDGAVTLVLSDPQRRNALGIDMVSALAEALETLRGAEGARVVFLRGSGGHFSAGGELLTARAALDQTRSDDRDDILELARLYKALWDLPMLTVALVEGMAFGGGAALAAVCDKGVATSGASFAFGEARAGLLAGVASPYLVGAVGPRAARRLLAGAQVFDAAEALRIGLVDEVVADAAALSRAQARISAEVLACAPGAVAAAKALVAEISGREIDTHLIEATVRRAAEAESGEEAQAGAAAILARRKPDWTSGR